MPALLVINAIGLLCGFWGQETFMYLLFGITWTAFFPVYENLTWPFYEKMTRGESDTTVIDVKMMHLVAMVIVMVSIYILAWFKFGKFCVLMSIIQFLIISGIKIYHQSNGKNLLILTGIFTELTISLFLL